MLAIEQVAQVQGDADVAGEERVATPAELRPLALDLAAGVHGESPRAVQPELVSSSAVEDEEGVRIPARAVAEARAPRDRPGAPRQFATGERELLVHDV